MFCSFKKSSLVPLKQNDYFPLFRKFVQSRESAVIAGINLKEGQLTCRNKSIKWLFDLA